MIIRGATLISRMAVIFAVLFTMTACGGGGGGSSFYDPDDGNSGPDTSTPLTITTTGLPDAIDGVQYTALVAAAGGTESYSWAVLDDGDTGLTINNGGILSGIAPASGSYGLSIQVTDSAGKNAKTSFILTVTGSSPAQPLTITTTGLPSAIDGIQYTALVQAAGGNGTYSWAVLDDGGTGFTITDGGILSGTAPTGGSYGLTLQVTDSAGENATTSLLLTVTGNNSATPLAITTTSLPDAAAGKGYNAVLQATGGQGDYQWTLLSAGGSGLQLNPDGLLNGTAPATGQYAITVSVQDDTRTVSSTLILTSGGAGAVPLAITTTALPAGIINQRYAAVLNAAGGNVPYVWTLNSNGGSGLTLTTAGVLSGVPVVPGTFGLVFSVSDGTSTAQSALTLTITKGDECVPINVGGSFICLEDLRITTTTLPPADRVLYAASVQAVGGVKPYSWSGGDTSSPGTGFKVDPASGSITGNANNLLPGQYGFTVTVTDSASNADTRSYVIEVPGGDAPPVRILTSNPLPTATEGFTYTVVMRAVGGGAVKEWEVLETLNADGTQFDFGPSFPDPISAAEGILFWSADPLNPNHVVAGNYRITIKVSSDDADGSADVVTFNLQAVPAPIRITTTNLNPDTASVGVNYIPAIMTSTAGVGQTNTWTVISTVPEAGGAPLVNGPTFASPGGNAATGQLFWAAGNIVVPSDTKYRVTIKVTNINNGVTTTDQETYTLTVI